MLNVSPYPLDHQIEQLRVRTRQRSLYFVGEAILADTLTLRIRVILVVLRWGNSWTQYRLVRESFSKSSDDFIALKLGTVPILLFFATAFRVMILLDDMGDIKLLNFCSWILPMGLYIAEFWTFFCVQSKSNTQTPDLLRLVSTCSTPVEFRLTSMIFINAFSRPQRPPYIAGNTRPFWPAVFRFWSDSWENPRLLVNNWSAIFQI